MKMYIFNFFPNTTGKKDIRDDRFLYTYLHLVNIFNESTNNDHFTIILLRSETDLCFF